MRKWREPSTIPTIRGDASNDTTHSGITTLTMMTMLKLNVAMP